MKNYAPPIDNFPPLTASFSNSNTALKNRIAYLHQNEVGMFHFGEGHPMKPARLALTHNLILAYGLEKKMSVYTPRMATDEEMEAFHSEDYIDFIKRYYPC